MQWRTAKHVLRNGFNKTITRVNWAFAECLELGTYSTKNPHTPAQPFSAFLYRTAQTRRGLVKLYFIIMKNEDKLNQNLF